LSQLALTDLLNSCPAPMANFFWFIDDKLLKFYMLQPQKHQK